MNTNYQLKDENNAFDTERFLVQTVACETFMIRYMQSTLVKHHGKMFRDDDSNSQAA